MVRGETSQNSGHCCHHLLVFSVRSCYWSEVEVATLRGRSLAGEKEFLLQDDLKKLKLHVWFMRLGYFSTFFIIALEWCSISDVLQVEVYFDMLGCIYKKLYFSLNST